MTNAIRVNLLVIIASAEGAQQSKKYKTRWPRSLHSRAITVSIP